MAEAIHIQTAKLMQQRVLAAYRIRAIAADFGAKLPADFELFHFVDLPIELIQKIVVKLMETKCTSLRREEMDMKVLMVPALDLYLAMKPRKVDLTAFLTFCPKQLKYQYLKESVIHISEKAADLEELTLVAPKIPSLRFFHDLADAELLKLLGKLRHLKVLRIEEIVYIRLTDLIQLCENLPDLEFLNVKIYNDICRLDFQELKIAEKLKSAMPKLQIFLFDSFGIENALIKCCVENLPNLRVIRVFSSVFSSFEDYYESSNETTRPSGSSNLRHLLVDYDVKDCAHLPSTFPLITHLRILLMPDADADAEEQNLTALMQLTHLESLEVINLPQDILHLFVEKFGPNLREISIEYDDECDSVSIDYSLGQLLALCPKLERLSYAANFKEDLKPIEFFSHLKEIRMDFWEFYENEHIRLTDIFRAPNLEKITFYGSGLDFEELRRVSTLIKEKKILRNLKKLHFTSHFNSVEYFKEDYFKEVAAFIKCVAASLPAISVITFDLHYRRFGYAALARTFTNGKTTNDEIDGITEFFENQIISSEFQELFVDEELIAILENYRC
ncbi:uncharacterized protein LOC135945299 [Cloeon dipterum]|uniref:uncharacterized protein LOC135945299 n=1 Tax=Cloeon dipterum TaxID=197152 RepID=UPI0032208164